METIEAEFSNVAITHLDIIMYRPKDALYVIDRCKTLNKKILGIDAFIVDGEKIQPFLEHSVDFTTTDSENGFWKEAKEFINEYINEEFVFEIVYK